MTLDDSYNLFRQAVVERDEKAWASLALRYRSLMIAWAMRCSAVQAAAEPCENLADEAFARAWMALSAERFAAFPNLAALLAYLRRCVSATVIDAARHCTRDDHVVRDIEDKVESAMEQRVLDEMERAELWQLVNSLINTERERVAVYERFVLDLPPRTIYARHKQLFPDIQAVYAAIRNLCERLRRHKRLTELYAERLAA
jgi:DNA-directed RNA polymerase specialized sigma24 family protein